jgi:uncharacterized protein YcaQ
VETRRARDHIKKIRWEAWWMQNIDKGLDMFIRHFKMGGPVAAVVGMQQGYDGEY